MESLENFQQFDELQQYQMIGYKGEVGKTLFAASDIIKVPVTECPEIRRKHPTYKFRTRVTSRYQNVKLSSVSISLCFRDKLKLSLIVYAGDSSLNA